MHDVQIRSPSSSFNNTDKVLQNQFDLKSTYVMPKSTKPIQAPPHTLFAPIIFWNDMTEDFLVNLPTPYSITIMGMDHMNRNKTHTNRNCRQPV